MNCYLLLHLRQSSGQRNEKPRHSPSVWGLSFHTKYSHKQLLVTFMFWLNTITQGWSISEIYSMIYFNFHCQNRTKVWNSNFKQYIHALNWSSGYLCQLELRLDHCHGYWPNVNSSANTDKRKAEVDLTGERILFHNFSPLKNHLVFL